MNGMWSESRYKVILLAVAMLSLAIIIGGYLLGDGLLRARQADRSVTVKGLAEKNVTADLATWNLSFSKQGFDINDVQSAIDHDANEIRALFKTMGFPDNALSTAGVNVNQWYASNRSEEHTSELQSLMRHSYAVYCLKKNNNTTHCPHTYT